MIIDPAVPRDAWFFVAKSPMRPDMVMSIEVQMEPSDLAYGLYPPYEWPEEIRPACRHLRLIESGFGKAYCRDCPATLRRGADLEWEVVS